MKKSEILTEVLKDRDGASSDLESSLLPVDGFMIASALYHCSEEDRIGVNAALGPLQEGSENQWLKKKKLQTCQ